MGKRISGKRYYDQKGIFRPKGIMDNNSVDATKDSTEEKDEAKLESGTETSLLFQGSDKPGESGKTWKSCHF